MPGWSDVRGGANHAGVATPDLEASIRWYAQVLGMRLLRGPEQVDARSPAYSVHADVFGPGFRGCRVAFLVFGDDTGIELFEFARDPDDGVRPADREEPRMPLSRGIGVPASPGLFHVALTCDDVAATAARVDAAGGSRLSDVHRTPRCTLCYCADPFGTVLELVDRPFREAHAGVAPR